MSRFDVAMKQLRTRLINRVGDPIIYRRGGQSASLVAYSGRTAFKMSDMGNVRVEWSDRDFFIPADQLILNGVRILPLRGDVVELTIPGEGVVTFEAVSPNDEQIFRFSDTCRSIIRLHTKKINS